MRVVCIGLLCLTVVVLAATPAGAQETDEPRVVEIGFDIGDFDGENGDWPISVVHVTGDMDEGVEFTVELRDEDGALLWSGTEPFTAPTTSFTVIPFVAVGDVASSGVSQVVAEVAGEQVERAPVEILRQGAGGGGSGQLALSMVMAVILVAIVFRSPLPSQSTQRWRK